MIKVPFARIVHIPEAVKVIVLVRVTIVRFPEEITTVVTVCVVSDCEIAETNTLVVFEITVTVPGGMVCDCVVVVVFVEVEVLNTFVVVTLGGVNASEVTAIVESMIINASAPISIFFNLFSPLLL